MPRYRVKAPGFHGGKLYSPTGKRRIVNSDKPLKPVPSWLESMEEETAAQIKARKEAEKKASKAEKAKAEQDKRDVEAVTFTEAPAPTQSNVETL